MLRGRRAVKWFHRRQSHGGAGASEPNLQLHPVQREHSLVFTFKRIAKSPFKETVVEDETEEIMGMERAACEKAALPSASLSTNEG